MVKFQKKVKCAKCGKTNYFKVDDPICKFCGSRQFHAIDSHANYVSVAEAEGIRL